MSTSGQASSSERRFPRRIAEIGAFFVPVLVVHLWLEFRAPGMHGVDGYYHIKLARLYATGELPFFGDRFPWMTHSIWTDHRCDWQAGYHVFLIPFTWMGLLLGGKVSAAVFAALVPTTVFAILRAERVRLAWLFAGLLCVASEYYLVRVHLARPTSSVVILLLLCAYLAARQRTWPFLVACTLALFTYCVPHNAGAVTLVAAVAIVVVERRVPRRLFAAAAVALVLGVLSNPGFWHWRGSFLGPDHALFDIWEQMGGSLQAASDGDRILIEDRWVTLQAPAEFQPPPREGLLASYAVPLFAFAAALVLLVATWLRSRTVSVAALTAAALAGLYLVLFVQHVRFAEYWIPFAFLAAGLAAAPRAGEAREEKVPAPAGRLPVALLVLGLGLVAWRAPTTLRSAVGTMSGETGIGLEYEAPMRWLAEHTPQDAVIFHARWPQFCPMFFFNHRNRYLIGLDPYFFYQQDPLAYERWIRISEGELPPEATLAGIRDFDAAHALVKRDTALDAVLRRSDALPTYEDGLFRIYEIGPGSPDR